MFFNYLKVSWRSLRRGKGFSAINIIGLAIGMASAIIILLWIQNEVSFDRFHEKKDRIYEAWNRVAFNDKVMTWNATPKPLARALEKELPEVEQATKSIGPTLLSLPSVPGNFSSRETRLTPISCRYLASR